MLISPGDVDEERQALIDACKEWNGTQGNLLGAEVQMLRWDKDCVPDMSSHPQNIVNQQILQKCDFAVAVFWSRLGTPTEKFDSGSVEEVETLRKMGKRLLVYFREGNIPPDSAKNGQYSQLVGYRDKWGAKGLLGSYHDVPELAEKFTEHLTNLVKEFLQHSNVEEPLSEETTLPMLDIRIRTSFLACINRLTSATFPLIQVKAENHSRFTGYMSNALFRCRNGSALFPLEDVVTRSPQISYELPPGKSHALHISPKDLFEDNRPEDLLYAVVIDEIGREYHGSEEELNKALEQYAEWKKAREG